MNTDRVFYSMTTGETELQRGLCWCVCSEVFRVKPHTEGRLEPRPDERSVCSTLVLLLPFTHSLALARAGTHTKTRVAWLSCRKPGAAGFPLTRVCVCQVPPSPVIPPWSPCGGYERCFFLLLWIYLDNSSTASAF